MSIPLIIDIVIAALLVLSLIIGGKRGFIRSLLSVVILVVSLLGSKFNEKILNIINKVCGAVIIFYGLKLAWSFVKMMGWVG